ncbi:MAG: hypothetical protein ABSD98_13615 [Candidatus Korobacteraceae bacterium]|jgi:hypothetical protein
MKRQLRPILAAVALLCGPLAWSQSSSQNPSASPSTDWWQNGSSDTSQSNSSDSTQSGSSDTSQSSSSNTLQTGSSNSSQSSASDTSQTGPSDTSQAGAPCEPFEGTSLGCTSDQSQSGLGGPQESFLHPEQLPALSLFSDTLSHTGYSFTGSVGEVAQHVSSGYSQPGYWNNLALFNSGINIVEARSKVLVSLGYNVGISTSSASVYGTYTNLNQAANAHIIWALAKRWQFRLKDNYFYSDDPFEPFLTYLGDPTPNNPNPVVYFPLAVLEQNIGTGDLTYLLGPHDLIDFTGGESLQRYLRGLPGAGLGGYNPGALWNSFSYSGGAFYQHVFGPKLNAGTGYMFSALDFGHGQSRAGVQLFQTYASYRLSSRMTVSAWVGPELTGTKDIVPLACFPSGCLVVVEHNSYLDVAEGGTFSWSAAHNNSFGAQYAHSITNGGGLFGAVRYYQATATYGRPLSRTWSVAAGFLYGNSNSVSQYQGAYYLHSAQGTVSFARAINRAWNLSTYYVYIHQKDNYYGTLGLPSTVISSGAGITLQYAWNHSLGR